MRTSISRFGTTYLVRPGAGEHRGGSDQQLAAVFQGQRHFITERIAKVS